MKKDLTTKKLYNNADGAGTTDPITSLSGTIIKDDKDFQTTWKTFVDELPSINDEPNKYLLENYKATIENNISMFKSIFGVELICFSRETFNVLAKLQVYARSTNTVLFQAESGAGRTFFAKIMHSYRGGGALQEISCQSESLNSLRSKIDEFLAKEVKDAPEGLIVKDLDSLSSLDVQIIDKLLKDFDGEKYIYLTASNDFVTKVNHLPLNILSRLRTLIINIPALRDRRYDLFYQIMYNLIKLSEKVGFAYKEVSKEVVKILQDYAWPSNSLELKYFIEHIILENTPPVLKTAKIVEPLKNVSSSNLSPLEESEKKVISNYLQKNNYNKARTSRELDITINTLNAKMEKYGVVIPKENE